MMQKSAIKAALSDQMQLKKDLDNYSKEKSMNDELVKLKALATQLEVRGADGAAPRHGHRRQRGVTHATSHAAGRAANAVLERRADPPRAEGELGASRRGACTPLPNADSHSRHPAAPSPPSFPSPVPSIPPSRSY